MGNEAHVLLQAGRAAPLKDQLGQAVAHRAVYGRQLAGRLDEVVVGVTSEGPRPLLCRLHVEGCLVHVADRSPAGDEVGQGEGVLSSPESS